MMEKYLNYTLEDFIWDDDFRLYVLSPTEMSQRQWAAWLKLYPEKSDMVNQAKTVVKSLRVKEASISDFEIRQLTEKVMSQIEKRPLMEEMPANTEGVAHEAIVKPIYKNWWFAVAASLLLLVSAAMWWLKSDQSFGNNDATISNVNDTSEMIESINKTANPQSIQLSDGSIVTLKKGSTLHYTTPFKGSNRIVHLSGEAFFDIKKDPTKPFLVYANGLVTKVLGTSFNIKAYPNDKNVVVEVKTGKVSVFSQNNPKSSDNIVSQELNGVVATPNQRIVFNRESVQIDKKLVELPAIVLPQKEQEALNFNFEDTPASEVFEVLKKAYEIDIIYDKAILKDCPITAPLTTQPLFEKLKIICKAIEANYVLLDGQILIQSQGCKN
jgi:transmembrane sensor